MDPTSVDSSLQKNSPDPDPAAIYHLSTEVSTQASILATHQQQLTRLKSVMGELIKTLQSWCLPTFKASQPLITPTTNAAAKTTATASTRLAFPEKYDGSPK